MINNGWNIFSLIQSKPIVYLFMIIIVSISLLISVFTGFSIYYLINIGNSFVDNKKKIIMKKKYFLYFLLFVILLLLFLLFYTFRTFLWELLSPVLWAVIFAYLLNPIVCMFEKKGISRIWSVTIVYISIIGIMVLFSITITPKITREARNLAELLPKYTNEVNEFLNTIYIKIEQIDNLSPQFTMVKETIRDHIGEIEYYILDMIKSITSGVFSIFSQIVSLVLIPIFTFYFLKDAAYFKKKMRFMIPKDFRNELVNICKDIDTLLNRFIRGQLIVAACVAALSIIVLLLIKVNFAFLIGIIAGIFNVIPYFGPIIGAVPGVVFALLDEPSKAFWVIVAFIVIQQIESAIISPKIVGESVGLHPIIVILVLLIGNEWLGIIGMLFAVPIAASVKIIGKHLIDFIIKG